MLFWFMQSCRCICKSAIKALCVCVYVVYVERKNADVSECESIVVAIGHTCTV